MLYPVIIQGIVFEAVLGIHGETDVEGCPTSDSEADQLRKFDLCVLNLLEVLLLVLPS